MRKVILGLTALLLTGLLPQLSGAQDHETTRSGTPAKWESVAPDGLCDYCEEYRREAADGPPHSVAGVRTDDASENGAGKPAIALTAR